MEIFDPSFPARLKSFSFKGGSENCFAPGVVAKEAVPSTCLVVLMRFFLRDLETLIWILLRKHGPLGLCIAGLAHRFILYQMPITEGDLARGVFSDIGFVGDEDNR